MRPVSDRWNATVRGSHQAVFEARAVEPGQDGVDPDGVVIPLDSGRVDFDADSDILGSCEITVSDPALFPTDPGDALAPFGNELWLRRGIAYGGGAVEWVSLGYFRIRSVEQDDARGAPFRVTGSDRMCRLIADALEPASFAAAQTYGEAVESLVTGAPFLDQAPYPYATVEWDDTALRDTNIGRNFYYDDRWPGLDALLRGIGQIWYWDHRGFLVVKPPPAASEPVWDVDSGRNGVLTGLGRGVSDDGVYNAVVVTGGSPPAPADPTPPNAGWYDDDPTSPTWFFGKFGKTTRYVSETAALTVSACSALAQQLLREGLSQPRVLDLSAVPNPALEVYDPVRVRLGSGIDETHLIRKLSIPLSTDVEMTAETQMTRPGGKISAF